MKVPEIIKEARRSKVGPPAFVLTVLLVNPGLSGPLWVKATTAGGFLTLYFGLFWIADVIACKACKGER